MRLSEAWNKLPRSSAWQHVGEILRWYREGIRASDIASKINASEWSVYQVLHKHLPAEEYAVLAKAARDKASTTVLKKLWDDPQMRLKMTTGKHHSPLRDDPSDIVHDFQSGMGINALSRKYHSAVATIRDILLKNGVTEEEIKNRFSREMSIRSSSPESIERLTAAARKSASDPKYQEWRRQEQLRRWEESPKLIAKRSKSWAHAEEMEDMFRAGMSFQEIAHRCDIGHGFQVKKVLEKTMPDFKDIWSIRKKSLGRYYPRRSRVTAQDPGADSSNTYSSRATGDDPVAVEGFYPGGLISESPKPSRMHDFVPQILQDFHDGVGCRDMVAKYGGSFYTLRKILIANGITPEQVKAHTTDAMKKKWRNPERKAKQSKTSTAMLHQRYQDPENIEKAREQFKERLATHPTLAISGAQNLQKGQAKLRELQRSRDPDYIDRMRVAVRGHTQKRWDLWKAQGKTFEDFLNQFDPETQKAMIKAMRWKEQQNLRNPALPSVR